MLIDEIQSSICNKEKEYSSYFITKAKIDKEEDSLDKIYKFKIEFEYSTLFKERISEEQENYIKENLINYFKNEMYGDLKQELVEFYIDLANKSCIIRDRGFDQSIDKLRKIIAGI